MRIIVAIATTGRPHIVSEAIARFSRQSPAPDGVLVVGATPEDAPSAPGDARFVVAPVKGSGPQRNHALDLIGLDADIVVFVDDDYAPAPGFIAGVDRLFAQCAEIVAASGHLIADGIGCGGLTFAAADALIAEYRAPEAGEIWMRDSTGVYGCNMAFRLAAAPQLRFDERLPLYAWLEDTDFSAQYARVGRVVRTNRFAGVHLGVVSSRASGLRLGYSQIANPLYLVRKGTASFRFAFNLAAGNVIANLVRSPWPEPWIDRRGRLRGNLLAFADILRGRIDPRRILEL